MVLTVFKSYLKHRKNPTQRFKPLPAAKLEEPIQLLLSVLALASSLDTEAQGKAFAQGKRFCNRYLLRDLPLLKEEELDFEKLQLSLTQLEGLPVPQKKVIFDGALAVVLTDEVIRQEELNLIRIFSAALNLPMPPLISKEEEA